MMMSAKSCEATGEISQAAFIPAPTSVSISIPMPTSIDANQTMAMLENIGLVVRNLHASLETAPTSGLTPPIPPTSSAEVMRVDDVYARMEEMNKRIATLSDVIEGRKKPLGEGQTAIERVLADREEIEFRARIKYVKRWFLKESLYIMTEGMVSYSGATFKKFEYIDETSFARLFNGTISPYWYNRARLCGIHLGMRFIMTIPFLILLDMLVSSKDAPVDWQEYVEEHVEEPIYAVAKDAVTRWEELSVAVLEEIKDAPAICARPGLLKAYASEIVGMFSGDPEWRKNLAKTLPWSGPAFGADFSGELDMLDLLSGEDPLHVRMTARSYYGRVYDSNVASYGKALYSIFYDPEP